ncbi:MAG: tRNA (N6-isopentenyl adenosine(37)-C2)-methylthiotransferase MiaB [bacterium]|nr:tRNA (N6-isopentenyl adenosine(37)-C2)-methylthiotransferase MiaB [bacterium]
MMREGKSIYLCTFGCQMNEHDSERIAGLLDSAGYQFVDREDIADIILFNTCCIRASAEQRVYGRVSQLGKLKKRKPELLIGILGCMAEKQQDEIFRKLPMVDFVIGPRQWFRIKETLDDVIQSRQQKVVCGVEIAPQVFQKPKRFGKIKAWVSIMEGCNNYCAYCVVPYVRGYQVSRPAHEIIAEVEQLANDGYKEITLLGQNVNAYRYCEIPNNHSEISVPQSEISFAELLRRLNRIDGIQRIRYTTSHPRDFSLEIIQAIQESPKVCEHFHLPIQSGSDYILNRMNRGYTFAQYQQLVQEIRNRFPTASITTDIIVGFPGETEEEYQKTLEAMRTIQWDSAFLFMFSPRSGTKAATLDNPVPLAVRKQRIREVIELQKQISTDKLKQLIGKRVEVLVEGRAKNKSHQWFAKRAHDLVWFGRTRQNIVAVFPADRPIQPGELISVTVKDTSAYTLFTEPAE